MRPYQLAAAIVSVIIAMTATAAETFIVKDGQPNAEIVIADNAERMVALGALELRYYLEKMTGAQLPIVTKPDDRYPVKIYVGESDYAEKLGVTAEGLRYEAFRMVSGENWLALIGEDWDYEPLKPFAQSPSDMPRARAEWDARVAEKGGGKWGFPFPLQYKEWWNPRQRARPASRPTQGGTEVEGYDAIMAARYGADTKHVWNPRSLAYSNAYQGPGAGAGFWFSDRGGSLNAVCEFLRSLGVRWYMPHEIGEVVPKITSVSLPRIDKTVRPDFPVRGWNLYNYNGPFFPDGIWVKRLGMNTGYAKLGYAKNAHFAGHRRMYDRMQESHPDYFALVGGKRHDHMACYSSETLAQETVRFVKFMYDEYDQPCVSIWPADGFIKCECELCRDKTPSDVVWGFVDRVARELYTTHPDRMVLCGAYTSYAEPPSSIETFSPNVLVYIANRGRPSFDHPDAWKRYWELLAGWRSKTAPDRIVRGDNNRYSLKGDRGPGKPDFPVIHPRPMAKDLQAMNGISIGERGEVSQSKARWAAPGCDHLTLYVQSRFLWDSDQDVEQILDDYYRLFYGPAEKEAREALEFAQANYNRLFSPLVVPLETRVTFLEKLNAARQKAGDTIYGERLQLMIDELPSLEESRQKLEQKIAAGDPREHNPVVTVTNDEPAQRYDLVAINTGETPDVATSFTVNWDTDALVFDITCQEPDMENIFATQTVWNGDSVAVLLEPPNHSYYQLEVNPDGVIFDADRLHGKLNRRWTARATVETERGDDFWRVTIRIPIVPPEKNMGDPFHYVVGPKPSQENPWYFNVGRNRIRGERETAYLFNPAGPEGGGYHRTDKFAKLVMR